jgi:amino acid permease
MKMIACLLAVVCVVVGVMYYVIPGGSLPTFMPGYDAASTHIHTMHAVAAVTAAVVFLLIGLSTRR